MSLPVLQIQPVNQFTQLMSIYRARATARHCRA
jgi:hypothetical protein